MRFKKPGCLIAVFSHARPRKPVGPAARGYDVREPELLADDVERYDDG